MSGIFFDIMGTLRSPRSDSANQIKPGKFMLFVTSSISKEKAKITTPKPFFLALFNCLFFLEFYFRIFRVPRFCGKQENNEQNESLLDITNQPFKGDHLKAVRADSLRQVHHIGLVTAT